MIYIATAALGFLLLFLFDVAALKRIPRAKPVIWSVASLLITLSIILLALSPEKLQLPAWSTWLGWILLPAAIFLMAYPILLNLPFRQTYIRDGAGDKLVTTGFYSLVRCPWVLTAMFLWICVILVSASRPLLIAALILVPLDMALAVMKDRFLFDKMFPTYARYREQTPMLIPNRNSLSLFLKTIGPELLSLIPGRPRKADDRAIVSIGTKE